MVDSSLIAFSPFYHALAKKQCPRGLNSRTGEKRKDTQSVSFLSVRRLQFGYFRLGSLALQRLANFQQKILAILLKYY